MLCQFLLQSKVNQLYIYIISPLFEIPFPYRSLQSIEQSSLGYTVGPYQLSILVIYFIYQFSSVAQSCLSLCDPINRSTPGLPVHHQLPESTQTHVHGVSDAIQPSHPLSSPSPPASNPSQHQGLFQGVNSSHKVAKVLEFPFQHQFFQ